jgi:TolB-like protein/DNA-binding winged helix-turn-helix (wHTH) protein
MPAEVQSGKPRIDLSQYALTLNGRRVKVERQPMDLLIFFVQHRGQLVTREDIVGTLWGKDVFVDVDRSINAAVRKIRSALGDDPDEPKFLETVVGRGYCFIGEVELVPSRAEASGNSPETAEPGPVTPHSGRTGWPALLVSAVLVILIIAAAWGWFQWRQSRAAQQAQIHSLAVLPFVNLSGDSSQDYFADGMTDELITDVAQISALRVISHTSVMQYEHTHKPLPQIARELGVDAVVEGTVLRAGDEVRISAQLVDARDDRHVWAQSYERNFSQLLALQNEVSRAIAEQVRAKITPAEQARLDAPRPLSTDNYVFYLKGRYFFSKGTEEGMTKAIECFQHIIDNAPSAAIAYAGMADAYSTLGPDTIDNARVAARKAIELDGNLAEAHVAMGSIFYQYDWNFAAAEKEFQRALSLNPNYPLAHANYGILLAALGRTQEALRERQEALALDPLSVPLLGGYGMTLFLTRRFEETAEVERRVLEMEPGREGAHFWLGYVYEQQGDYKRALAEYRKAMLIDDAHAVNRVAIGRAYALAGNRVEAMKVEAQIRDMSRHAYVWPYDAALLYTALGRNDEAFQWLEKCYKDRDSWLVVLNVDPRIDGLRNDPRFAQLVARVGLPASTQSSIR